LLARGLLKRFHTYAVAILGEPVDAGEAELVEWYLESGSQAFMNGEWLAMKPAVSDNRLARPDLRKRLMASVGCMLGERITSNAPGCVIFEVGFQEKVVRTLVF